MFRILVFLCCAFAGLKALAENVPRPASARKTPVRTTNSPIKTRKLKKADREADFFFMNGYDVDGISVWSVVVAEPPLFRQHFFQFVGVIALGFYWVRKRLASFFPFFKTPGADWTDFCYWRNARIRMRMVTAVFTISMPLNEVSKT